ncbi:MAG TPA: hypothetical protein VIS27_07085 [Yeosuana sp.]
MANTDYTITGISSVGDTAKTEIYSSLENTEGDTFSINHNGSFIEDITIEELEQIETLIHNFVALRQDIPEEI